VRGGKTGMEETLYNIEIHKDEEGYFGRIYSDIDGMKEFKSNNIDKLLRDITLDMQLALEEFTGARSTDFIDIHEK